MSLSTAPPRGASKISPLTTLHKKSRTSRYPDVHGATPAGILEKLTGTAGLLLSSTGGS
jgi:hypothetical protein